jgi:hypothetical protein
MQENFSSERSSDLFVGPSWAKAEKLHLLQQGFQVEGT